MILAGEMPDNKVNPDDLAPDLPEDATGVVPDDLPSYDQCVPTDDFVAPPELPPPPDSFEKSENDASGWSSSAALSSSDALDALAEHIEKNCCWGKGPMEKMKVKSVEPSTAYKYLMNSWNERRKVNWTHRPYHGGMVDGPHNGPPPGIWQVQGSKPKEFDEETYKKPVPHTEEVRTCWRCHGRGQIRCTRCRGRGHVDCPSCSRGVKSDGERCGRCRGGRLRCTTCGGDGLRRCFTCEGSGRLCHYLLLTIDFKDHDDKYIYETTDLPDKLILSVKGTELMKEKAFRVGHIFNFPVEDINKESAKLVHEHATKWPNEVCHMQKHSLFAIPVNEIIYDIDGESGKFWVYGNEMNVFSFDYPAQCCWCFNVPGCFKNCTCCGNCCNTTCTIL